MSDENCAFCGTRLSKINFYGDQARPTEDGWKILLQEHARYKKALEEIVAYTLSDKPKDIAEHSIWVAEQALKGEE